MMFKLPLTVPLRFLTAISHIVITGIILMYREWNLNGCDQSKTKEDQFIIALSFIIGLTGLEIISLILGISLYSNLQTFISTAFHFAGFISTLFFMFYRACSDLVWIIFGICSFIPFMTEIITIFRICLCKQLPAW